MNDKSKILEFYGGPYMAFIPTILFIIFTSIITIEWHVFSLKTLVVAGVCGLLVGFLLAKSKFEYWKSMINGLTKFGNAKLIFVFMIIGIFTKLLITGKIGAGFIWLSTYLGIYGSTFCVLAFLGSGIMALGIGVPFPALFASLPIFYVPGILLGSNPAILCGAIIGGVHFGDALAVHSQLTNATSEGQTNLDTLKKANPKLIVKQRIPSIIITGFATIVLLLLFGSSNTKETFSQSLSSFSDAKGLWMIIPIIVVVCLGYKTGDILTSLLTGIIVGTFIGLTTGLFSVNKIISINIKDPSALSGFISDGVYSMVDISLTTIFLFGLISIMNDSNVIELICKKITNYNFIKTPSGGKIIIFMGIAIVDLLLCGCDLPAILLFSNISNKIGNISKVSAESRSALLISVTAAIPGIIPINSVYIMGSIGIISQMKKLSPFLIVPSPVDIFNGTFFCWILTLFCLIWIIRSFIKKY